MVLSYTNCVLGITGDDAVVDVVSRYSRAGVNLCDTAVKLAITVVALDIIVLLLLYVVLITDVMVVVLAGAKG